MDRDHNSGINIENEGLKQVGAVRIELTPVEIEANTLMFLRYFNSIPWQRIWGMKILSTSIGGIISTLKQKVHTPVEVNRMYPSTKTCSKCGNIQDVALDERVYVCKNKKCSNIIRQSKFGL